MNTIVQMGGHDVMLVPGICLLISVLAAFAYGLIYNRRPASWQKTVCKTLAVGGLAGVALGHGAPAYLIAALAFSALGDALLAAPGQRRFLLGVVAFAVAHGCYVPLFLQLGAGQGELGLVRQVVIATFGLVAASVLFAHLWRHLGAMKGPLTVYFVIILAMTGLALALPDARGAQAVALGALAFATSDMILGHEMFALPEGAPQRRWTGPAVWVLYYGGQFLITVGAMRLAGVI